jgi:hypothetical protein
MGLSLKSGPALSAPYGGGMLDKLRQFLQTRAGVATAGGVVVLALIAFIMSLRSTLTNDAEDIAANRLCIDTDGKTFKAHLKIGDQFPVRAPSGKDGYPAELCFWNKDGSIRKEPYPVLLNTYAGKPEPTFCPDCGRLVVGHNPAPQPGRPPPPTKDQYKPNKTPDRF